MGVGSERVGRGLGRRRLGRDGSGDGVVAAAAVPAALVAAASFMPEASLLSESTPPASCTFSHAPTATIAASTSPM